MAKELAAHYESKLKGKKKLNTATLEAQLNNATTLNDAYRKAAEYNKTEKEREELKAQQMALTEDLEKILKQKEEAIMSAKPPIQGLNIDSEGVTFNNIPFTQLSSSEQLKVSLAIAMAMNPKLRVIRIMDGSLLDKENMKIISDMIKEKDYQVWIERVEEDGNVGITIEDGQVKK